MHALVADASSTDLARRTDGTRWINRRMVFGFMIIPRLLSLVWLFGQLPDGFSLAFAAMLNTGTRPFQVINYLGSCDALAFHGSRLGRLLDLTVETLHRRLDVESEQALRRRCTSRSAGTCSLATR